MKKQNKVLIDLAKLRNPYCGLGQVSYFLGEAIQQLAPKDFQPVFLLPPKNRTTYSGVPHEFAGIGRQFFPGFKPKYDLWHAIHQDSVYLPARSKAPYLLTIHDLNFLDEKNPDKSMTRLQRLQKKVDRATAITTISDYSKQQIEKYLDVDNKPIHIVYNGVQVKQFPLAKKPQYVPEGDFLFTIGVVRQKKNFHVLIDMLHHLPNYNIILAGDTNSLYANEMREKIKAEGLENRFIMAEKISDEDKYWLYKNCQALVFPSLLEGFGLPVIEAMRFGKPVFLSHSSSLPEIGGEEAYYWDNFDGEYMAVFLKDKMENFKRDKEKVKRLIAHSEKFTWIKAAEAYIALYKKYLGI